MRRDDYWNLFWLSGMPEAWMLSRPTESYLFPPEPGARELTGRRNDLPEEARQLHRNQAEATQNLTAE